MTRKKLEPSWAAKYLIGGNFPSIKSMIVDITTVER